MTRILRVKCTQVDAAHACMVSTWRFREHGSCKRLHVSAFIEMNLLGEPVVMTITKHGDDNIAILQGRGDMTTISQGRGVRKTELAFRSRARVLPAVVTRRATLRVIFASLSAPIQADVLGFGEIAADIAIATRTRVAITAALARSFEAALRCRRRLTDVVATARCRSFTVLAYFVATVCICQAGTVATRGAALDGAISVAADCT